jgi:MGT family glycosyltransferase
VHVLSHDSTAKGVVADGASFHRLERAVQFSASDVLDPAIEIAHLLDHIWESPLLVEDFRRLAAELRPDVVLVDHSLGSVLIEARTSPAPTGVLYHTVYGPDGRDRMVAHFSGRPLSSDPANSFRALLESLPLVLVFSHAAFNPQTDFPPSVHHVGPIREPSAPAEWPRRYPDRPLVLVSLSTSFMNQQATLQRICDAVSSLPLEALVTTGESVVAAELTAGENVELRAFAPHDQVLDHADLVITHAGHGTVMAAVGAGVPLLCLPMGRDQPGNAARVEALGLGRVLSPAARPGEIAAVATAMLNDPTLGHACRAFAAGLSRFGDLGRAADLVEGLAP